MKLTDEQEEVVAIASGRHLVLAPPGSGKTEMLSQRILRALANGVDAKRMLCATFTNRAAFEMRERVEKSNSTNLPDVGNLHHFCHRYLMSVGRLHPDKHVLDDIEQREFIKEVVDVLRDELAEGSSDDGRLHGVAVAKRIQGIDNELRRKHLSGLLDDYVSKCHKRDKSPYTGLLSGALIAHQARIGIPFRYRRELEPQLYELLKEGVLRAIAIAYAAVKRRFDCVDFDDLINEAFLSLERNPMPEERKFLWVQIDEVQDLNPMQWHIVTMMTAQNAVSVYFGDIEQSIFSFLGASSSAFKEVTRGCTRHYFKTNFRATPILLEILMRYSIDALASDWEFLPAPANREKLVQESGMGQSPELGRLTISEKSIEPVVVEHIRQLLSRDIAENVAILVPTNVVADAYENAVRPLGFRTVKVSGLDLFCYAPMRDFLAFVSLFNGQISMNGWSLLFHRFAYGMRRRADARYFVREMFASGYDPLVIVGKGEGRFANMGSSRSAFFSCRRIRELSSMRKVLRPAVQSARVDSFRTLFESFAEIALGEVQRYSAHELLLGDNLGDHKVDDRELYAMGVTRARERIERFLRYADHVYANDPRTFAAILEEDWMMLGKLKEADLLIGDEKIVISTVHKAKGRQFDAVVVPSVKQLLLHLLGGEKGEEQRLLYVAMSRAKRHLSLFGAEEMYHEVKCIAKCFEEGYGCYYLRNTDGEFAEDWLWHWERLAEMNAREVYDDDVVEAAMSINSIPVVRMIIKCFRFIKDATVRRERLLDAVRPELNMVFDANRDVTIDCLRQCAIFDDEAVGEVRYAMQCDGKCRTERAAIEYFRSAGTKLAIEALEDLTYSRFSDIRCCAASSLAEFGRKEWTAAIVGSSRDFEYLASISDPAREVSIRTILAHRPPDAYSKRLRNILKSRAF